MHGGVLVAWDENHFTAGQLDKAAGVLVKGRMVEVTLQDKAGDMITIIGTYMPTRDKPEHTVRPPWEALKEAVVGRPGAVVMGDLNAETPEALTRAGRTGAPYPTLADSLLRELDSEEGLYTMGPGQDTYTRGGRGSQIDHIICDAETSARIGSGKVEPGIRAHDHSALAVEYTPRGESVTGPARPLTPRLELIPEKAWGELVNEIERAVDRAMEGKGAAGGERGAIERHEARQGAILRVIRQHLEKSQEKRAESKKAAGGKTKVARLRERAGKWEGLRKAITEAGKDHVWFSGEQRRTGRRIWKVKELQEAALAPATRRARKRAMLRIATYQAAAAVKEYYEAQNEKADGMLEELREAVREGGEGGVTTAIFRMVNAALGREGKGKGKGKAGKHATRPPKQVALGAVFKDNDKKANVVLTVGGQVLTEVSRLAERVNKAGRSFPALAREMMHKLRPPPTIPDWDPAWLDQVLGWERFEWALGRVKPTTGVGVDGFPAYALRRMPIHIRQAYHADICAMLRSKRVPEQWREWVSILAMKKGEDPRDLSRRRDLWLAPHSLKVVTRCLSKEYDEAVHRAAPASNTGFRTHGTAPGQTLTLKMHRAMCHRRKQRYLVGMCDMGCYFMSVCREVQRHAEEWAGVRPEVTDVMAALQTGIRGRCDTAHGMCPLFNIMRGIMQGCICSPARSLLQLRFMQELVAEAVRGYRFREGGVPMVFYCDDGAYMAETLAGLQMAFDACWVAARVAGLDVRAKPEEAVTRRGTKTAWMGCYYDERGREREITGYTMRFPTGEEIPQVSQYTHLGVSIQVGWKARHEEAREHVARRCTQLVKMIGKIDMLGPNQMVAAMDLAIGGVIGYTGRSTPIDYDTCKRIEAERAKALRKAGIGEGRHRAALFLPLEAGGMGLTHAYQMAAAAYLDQFERAFEAGKGEPAREAVEGAVAAKAKDRGYDGEPREWRLAEEEEAGLDPQDEVEAWLLYRLRARISTTMVTKATRTGNTTPTQDRQGVLTPPVTQHAAQGPEGATLGRARRTATCWGGWEYELTSNNAGQREGTHRRWV